MASPTPPGTHGRAAGQLWQFPLLTLSVGLFGYAAYVFIDPKPGPTLDQKIDVARTFLYKDERPEAAIDQLNGLLATQGMDKGHEGQVHTLLATSLDALQTQRHLNLKAYREQIIDQTRMAAEDGAKPSAESERRLGECYEALAAPRAALEHYRAAMTLDPGRSLWLQRKVIDLQLADANAGPAMASLEAYLKAPELTGRERTWALCNKAKLLVDAGEFVRAQALLDEVLRTDADPASHGQANYYLGYCKYKLGDPDQAAALLRLARQLLRSDHPLDAKAAYLLGQIFEGKREWAVAESFYRNVLVDHPGCDLSAAALLGRGMCRVQDGRDDAGLTDLSDLTKQLLAGPSLPGQGRAADRADAIVALGHAADLLAGRANYKGAVELLDDEQQLEPGPSPAFYRRLADVYERRGRQLEQPSVADDATPADAIRRSRLARACYTKAGDACLAYAGAVTGTDDRAYGDALWHSTELYDRAGNVPAATSALDLFVAQRPRDPLAAEALLRLGTAYEAGGHFDRAIDTLNRLVGQFPTNVAAGRAAVPLAEAYLAASPEAAPKAEAVLLDVLQNNPTLTPESVEFRDTLFELATLYYRGGQYEKAIPRLSEMAGRYKDDPRQGQLLFMEADAYRKSAALLAAKPAAAGAAGAPGADPAATAARRRERLSQARAAYELAVTRYGLVPPATDTDRLYQKLSYFYRADCAYDLGDYADAVALYNTAAFQYQEDPAALAAYVQIVNADYAMGKPNEARAINEQAKLVLKRMRPEAFANGTFAMPKAYWENQLNGASASIR